MLRRVPMTQFRTPTLRFFGARVAMLLSTGALLAGAAWPDGDDLCDGALIAALPFLMPSTKPPFACSMALPKGILN